MIKLLAERERRVQRSIAQTLPNHSLSVSVVWKHGVYPVSSSTSGRTDGQHCQRNDNEEDNETQRKVTGLFKWGDSVCKSSSVATETGRSHRLQH
ncbi:hypothetical protein BaRGS_00035089 [Batillaria attramentaria]|uniref:Uncharacterized protein n=1 Tax=Batillaria attramentaria TaxID=370345 RepID=A0ABD0JFK0_9CAEN